MVDEIVNLDLENFLGRLITALVGEFMFQHKTSVSQRISDGIEF